MQCGLLGKKLGHSYSPQIHSHLGDYNYSLYEVEPQDLGTFLQSSCFDGLNVTIPYKKDVIPYCNQLSLCAQKLGAVNTIVRKSDGTLVGHNTDYFGFRSMVETNKLVVAGKKVLVLGSGGASATVCAVLEEMGANVVVISRTGKDNYKNLHLHTDAAVIVNATPVGMYPSTQESPVNLDIFPCLEGVLDLIYNPARTKLLQQAQQRGLVAQNGLLMLVAQAAESAEWFTGKPLDKDTISRIHTALSDQMENLILIGMPGSGKTTVGQLLAKATGKIFIDADAEIVKHAGISIPEIFRLYGEDGFRQLETKVLSEIGKASGAVIATGGGCITQSENYPLLHQNGRIIWLKRNLDELPTDGRPLSQTGNLEAMYSLRKPMYQAFSDITVNNDRSPDEAVWAILAATAKEV